MVVTRHALNHFRSIAAIGLAQCEYVNPATLSVMDWKKLRFWQKPSSTVPKLDYNILAKYDGADTAEGDRLVLDALVKAGADLSLPREVLHYFYFPDEANARSVAVELRQGGFEAEAPLQTAPVEETRNPWRVLATVNTVVSI